MLQNCQQCRHSWSSTSYTAKTAEETPRWAHLDVLYLSELRLECMAVSCSAPFPCLNRGRGAVPHSDLQDTKPVTCYRHTGTTDMLKNNLLQHLWASIKSKGIQFSCKGVPASAQHSEDIQLKNAVWHHHGGSSASYWVSSQFLPSYCDAVCWPWPAAHPAAPSLPKRIGGKKTTWGVCGLR